MNKTQEVIYQTIIKHRPDLKDSIASCLENNVDFELSLNKKMNLRYVIHPLSCSCPKCGKHFVECECGSCEEQKNIWKSRPPIQRFIPYFENESDEIVILHDL